MRKITRCILPAIIYLYIFSCKAAKYSESRRFLKEYAFCKCLEFAYQDGIGYRNKDISFYVYQEIGHYVFDVYDKIDSMSRNRAFAIRPSIIADYEGKKAILMNCFRYYRSKELDSVVRSVDNKTLKSWQSI